MKKRIWINDRLAALGKKQAGLAQALGKPSPRVSEIIKGTRGIKASEVQIIADFLDMNVEEFMALENGHDTHSLPVENDAGMEPARAALDTIMKNRGLTMNSLANAAGLTESAFRSFMQGRTQGMNSLSFIKLSEFLKVPVSVIMGDSTHDALDAPPANQPPVTKETQIITDTSRLVSEQADMPVYASAQGGCDGMILDMGQIVEWVKTPAPLFGVKGAYAMYVVGDSMEPVYDQGDMLLIHPYKPAYKSDDVIVSTTSPDGGESRVLIKRLVKMTSDEVKLYQFNPPKEFSIPRSEVHTVHLVVGKYRRR